MTAALTTTPYFSHTIQINTPNWHRLELDKCARLVADHSLPEIVFYRHLSAQLNSSRSNRFSPVSAAQIQLYASLLTVYRYIIDTVAYKQHPDLLLDALQVSGYDPLSLEITDILKAFVDYFPPAEPSAQNHFQFIAGVKEHHHIVLRELLLLRLAAENRSLDPFREILDDALLVETTPLYGKLFDLIETALQDEQDITGISTSLMNALRLPICHHPDSLIKQLEYARQTWGKFLPPPLLEHIAIAFDVLREEERGYDFAGDGDSPLPPVMEFGQTRISSNNGQARLHDGTSVFGGYDYPEHEAFSADADWMPNVVLMAKMVYVWLDQLSRQYKYPITRLDQIPEAELATMANRGFTGLWLIGIWERSPASQRIKELCGNPDAIASAYSLYDYEISADIGGWDALVNLRQRALKRGIRLASDMVPNHTGIYSRWVLQHPDWFVQVDYPPFPTYTFTGENLSHSDNADICVEDGYWTKTDAAVVFRMIEHSTGRTRYIYHGNDGTTIPWNDTAQLNYMLPEVREAVIQTILHVARNFPIIRFDAAMTLAKKHYQRLWYPIPGWGGGIPSRSEHGMNRDEFDALFPVEFWREVVDRVAQEAPGTLLLAEAFWLMEGYFVRTLGMHRVYNSAFMNMLMKEENAKYRQTIKNVLAFNPEVLQRFVNFMNNPDEKTAVEQFGSEGKYFGSCLLLSTMPGLPMFGHGQIEGFREKYGMEYKRAYWDEQFDDGLIKGHEMWIFPILRKRAIFSGATNFALYDFMTEDGVDENVYAYSNRSDKERALILFNNKHAKTAGWIRESSPIALNNSDVPELATVSISKALAITCEKKLYYGFSDHTRGLQYLRSSQELHQNGLYAELAEYEFHIFSNFIELQDNGIESIGWGTLCTTLQGRGVKSLEDELKQLRHPELNHTFSCVLRLIVEQANQESASYKAELLTAIQNFQKELMQLRKSLSVAQEQKQPLKAEHIIKILNMVEQSFTDSLGEIFINTLAPRSGKAILLSWLLLQNENGEILQQVGLAYTLCNVIGKDDNIALLWALCETPLTPVLNTKKMILTTQKVAPCLVNIEKIFLDNKSRSYMQIHKNSGVEWFNKERFEELSAWHCLINFIQTDFKATVVCLKNSKKEYEQLCLLAQNVGYRTELFLQATLKEQNQTKHKKTAVIKAAKKHKNPILLTTILLVFLMVLAASAQVYADENITIPVVATTTKESAQPNEIKKDKILNTQPSLPADKKAGVEFGYELDPYYTNISYSIPLTDDAIPEVTGKNELAIYSQLFKNSLVPRFMLVEAAVFPMPLIGVAAKQYTPDFYRTFNVGTSDLNLLEAITAGFQEPYAISIFFGDMVSFVKLGEEKVCSNKGYMGYLFSYSNQHIKRNVLIPDHSLEAEWKLKGDRVFKDDKLSWSFRVGAKVHENPDIANSFYLGFRRSNLDFSANFFSFLDNSSIDFRWDFSAKNGRPLRQEYTVGKKFPISRWHVALKMDVGVIWEAPEKYKGALHDSNFQSLLAVIRPNIEF